MDEKNSNQENKFGSGLSKRGYSCVSVGKQRDNPADIYYKLYGDDDGKKHKVIFLSGMGTRGDMWENQTEELVKRGCSVLVIDNRGSGQSSAISQHNLGRYTTKMLASDAFDVLNHLNWTQNIHIVGLSMGGMVAQELALREVDRFVSLTLVSTHAGGRMPQLGSFSGTFGILSLMFKRKNPRRYITDKIGLIVGPKFKADEKKYEEFIEKRFQKLMSLGFALPTTRGRRGQLFCVLTHKVSRQRLEEIKKAGIRCLVISGTHDKLVNTKNSKWLSEVLECELVMMDNIGHAPCFECVEEFNEVCVSHVKDERTNNRGKNRLKI